MDSAVDVLLVDDDADLAALAATFLEREDDSLRVRTACDADAALERLEGADIDCVVSDFDMPGRNGIEFLEVVRARWPDLPFILFTGKGSEEVASDAISAGVTDYLQKETGRDQYAVLANRIGNVVEQRRAGEAATATERRLRELSEKTPDVLWMFSGDWSELLFVNSAYEEIYGRPVAEVERDPDGFLTAIHPDDRETIRAAMGRLADGEPVELEYRVDPRCDYERWVWVSGKPIVQDGEVVRIVGFTRDITERKERERTLADERAITQGSLDAIEDIYYLVGPAGRIERWNRAGAVVTGYDDETLSGMDARDLFVDEHRERVAAAILRVVTEGSARVTADLLTSDGRRLPYEFTGSRLTDEQGELRGVVGIGRAVGSEVTAETGADGETDANAATGSEDADVADSTTDADGGTTAPAAVADALGADPTDVGDDWQVAVEDPDDGVRVEFTETDGEE
jgi:PAS domain S-box-containing protein